MKYFYLVLICLAGLHYSCTDSGTTRVHTDIARQPVDTVGFAQYSWQMDSLMSRLDRKGWIRTAGDPWKIAICPHDDYTYVGKLYPEVLHNIKAGTLILIGVAHRAAQLGIEDSLVFDTYSEWRGPWKDIPVSGLREEIYSRLKNRFAIISDTLQKVEHSLESLLPFLQYFNRDIEIVPVLVPSMSPERMDECGKALAESIREVTGAKGWEWGKDYAVVVTTDAVHYGNEDWGGSDRAYFGCDSAGNIRALEHEAEIIRECLGGDAGPENIRLFSDYTLQPDNFREYKWTWCGRYSVPLALYTAYYLNGSRPINGELIGYSTSITSEHIPVDDLMMGRTAIATACHWVGYPAIGYR